MEAVRVGGSSRKGPIWTTVVTLCVLVFGGIALWLLDEFNRSQYIHQEYHGTALMGKDLRRMYLRWSDMKGAILSGTDLRNADLTGTILIGADLRTARLDGTLFNNAAYDQTTHWPSGFDPQARGARLLAPGSNCRGVRLSYENLERLNLRGADLQGADLMYAKLLDTDLRNADLRGAYLWGADLSRAKLKGAKLTGTEYDARTRWPAGVDPQKLGAVQKAHR